MWPADADSLVASQDALATQTAEQWTAPSDGSLLVGGCWVCFPRGMTGRGHAGDPAWTAATVLEGARVVDSLVLRGEAAAPYAPGLLALRIGSLLETAVTSLARLPDVLLVDATGRDHPRGAGLALHLGAVVDLPTVGITHRPLIGDGPWPADRRGATAPVRIDDTVVACWLCTRAGTRPLVVHPGWRVDLETAVAVVLATARRRRTPEPLRVARRLARRARNSAGS